MAIVIDRRKVVVVVDPSTGRRRTVIGSLRNVAACALGGAVIAGAAFGHDLRGIDPGEFGAVAGAVLGLIGWAAGRI